MPISLYTQEQVERMFKPLFVVSKVAAKKSHARVPAPWRFAYYVPGRVTMASGATERPPHWMTWKARNGRSVILSNDEIMYFEIAHADFK